jgi:hypothetical protein
LLTSLTQIGSVLQDGWQLVLYKYKKFYYN